MEIQASQYAKCEWDSTLVLAAIFAFILLRKDAIEADPAPEYMIEIRIENRTEQRFENLKFGIADANDTVLEDIDFDCSWR